jgi:Phage tail tube protein
MNGNSGLVGLGLETTWGTGVVPVAFFNAKESVTEDRGRLREDFTFGTRAMQAADRGRIRIAGSITDIAARPQYLGHLLKGLIGAPTSSGAANYTHVFLPTVSEITTINPLPSYSLTTAKGTKVLRYTGGQMNKMQIEQSKDGFLKIGSDWIFRDVAAVAKPTNTLENNTRFRFSQLNIKRAGTNFPFVEDLKISIDNGLDMEEVFDESEIISAVSFGAVMKVDVAMTITFRDLNVYNDFRDNVVNDWTFLWTITATQTLEVKIPQLNIDKYSDPIAGPGRLTISVSGVAEFNVAAGYDLRVTLKNQTASY